MDVFIFALEPLECCCVYHKVTSVIFGFKIEEFFDIVSTYTTGHGTEVSTILWQH